MMTKNIAAFIIFTLIHCFEADRPINTMCVPNEFYQECLNKSGIYMRCVNAEDKAKCLEANNANIVETPQISKISQRQYKDNADELCDAAKFGNIDEVESLVTVLNINNKDCVLQKTNEFTVLHIAAMKGHEKIVEMLIKRKADVNVKNQYGYTPLHQTVSSSIVEKLIRQGADVNAKSDILMTPLQNAVISGNLAVVEKLIEKGADVNTQNVYGYTPLHHAAERRNHLNIIEKLIENGADFKIEDNYGRTPLEIALQFYNGPAVIRFLESDNRYMYNPNQTLSCQEGLNKDEIPYKLLSEIKQGNIKIVREALEAHQAIINAKSKSGWTLAHWAVFVGNKDIVELFLDKGANVNIKSENNYTLLHLAVKEDNLDLAKFLISRNACVNTTSNEDFFDSGTSLHIAAANGNLEIAKLLLNKGANINAVSWSWVLSGTPLHFAVSKGQVNMVHYLLSNSSIDIKIRDNFGNTPLNIADKDPKLLNIADILRNKNAENNIVTSLPISSVKLPVENNVTIDNNINGTLQFNMTELCNAAEQGDFIKVSSLVTNLNVNTKGCFWSNTNNFTVLHMAAMKGHDNIVEMLIKKGADVNVQNQYGYTPLHDCSSASTIEILIKNGADVNALSDISMTPLQNAALNGNLAVVEKLIENFADVNTRNAYGYTPLHHAARGNHLEVIEKLVMKGVDFGIKDFDGKTSLDVAVQYYNGSSIVKFLELAAKFGAEDTAMFLNIINKK